MKPQDKRPDLRIIDESFNLSEAVAAIVNLFGYVTMALPFATILISLFLGMWGVTRLSDAMAVMLPGLPTVIAVVANGIKLLLMLMAARTIFLTLTALPPFLPDYIEFVRRELRKEFDL
jgi:hypothetical protein